MISVEYIDGFVQDCSISIAKALEILQSCTKPSIYEILNPIPSPVCKLWDESCK